MSLPNTVPPFLNETVVKELADLLDETHPQAVLAAFQDAADGDAAVFFVMCARCGKELAAHIAKIFAQLPFQKKVSIAEKITQIEVVDTERAAEIWHAQVAQIKETLQQTAFLGEGTENLAKLLSYMEVAEQNQLLEALAEKDPEIVGNISEQLFTFEDIDRLQNEGIKTILKVLDKQTLAVALHNAPRAIHDRFFENMAASEADAVEAASAQLTFEQTQIAETARQSVVNLVRNFAAKGLLTFE